MGIIMQPTRAISQQVFSRASNFCTARLATGLRRVNPGYDSEHKSTAFRRQPTVTQCVLPHYRSYATATVTATVKTPGKPKAHTGRTKATKSRTASSTKKPAAKKATSATKSKAKPKPRKRAKAKAKPKPRKRVLTEKQKQAQEKTVASQKQKALRTKALLSPPKGLPSTAWGVILQDQSRGKTGVNIGASAKEASSKYKSITPEEREQLNHRANENKAKNEIAHKQWLLSFTPKQIKEANSARLALNRHAKATGGKKHHPRIRDDRLVKPAGRAYTYFAAERNASGDMNGMRIGEIGGLVGKEWNALSASRKKVSSPLNQNVFEKRLI